MKFCANLSFMFAEASSILERYALAKDAGFKAVESGFPFGFSLEQVRNAKQSAGLQQIAINLKTGEYSVNIIFLLCYNIFNRKWGRNIYFRFCYCFFFN